MSGYTTCNGGSCHGSETNLVALDNLSKHNVDRAYPGRAGLTGTVSLSSTVVVRGTPVTVTSSVRDASGSASRVGGAEYYIDTDPGQGKGIPMNATDGIYDAVSGAWENVNGTIDTSALSAGTHIIYVRGVDIGKQWSAVQSATLTVEQSFGYINGTVTSAGQPVLRASVSTSSSNDTTGSDGAYSLRVPEGTYNVTASKQPEYYDNTITDVVVTPFNTTPVYIVITGKPSGTLSGVVRSV